DWMQKNPDLVPYLTDNERDLEKAKRSQRVPEIAVPTQQEIVMNLSEPMQALIAESQQGQDLPEPVRQQLLLIAERYDLTEEQMLGIVGLQ
ncbi:MAG TPA: hypothetical protein VJ742_08775, partial [Nitrososphaera sp.]|nr:hypothetical protein [Nitrososphaera sp.]